MMREHKVLVAGATGQLGVCVVAELNRRGYAVRAVARDPGKLSRVGAQESATADLTAAESLLRLCDGVDAVISCAGASMNINHFGDRKSFQEVDYRGNQNLLSEAKRAGVQKFVYVSLANAGQLLHTEYAAAHERFVESLRSSGMPHAVVRPTGFFGFHLEILKFARKGRGLLIGAGDCRANPIHEADVAVACVDALGIESEELIVGGPDVYTRREVVEMAFAALRRPPRLTSIPPWVFTALIAPLKLFNPRIHALMRFGVAVSQIDVVAPVFGSRRLSQYFEMAAAGREAPP
jgi:uncharacterized protein YbjT (DUF2867 family)